jgi:hypothetical protein
MAIAFFKHSDEQLKLSGDQIQYQGKGKEWYHEDYVADYRRKQFLCGRCVF